MVQTEKKTFVVGGYLGIGLQAQTEEPMKHLLSSTVVVALACSHYADAQNIPYFIQSSKMKSEGYPSKIPLPWLGNDTSLYQELRDAAAYNLKVNQLSDSIQGEKQQFIERLRDPSNPLKPAELEQEFTKTMGKVEERMTMLKKQVDSARSKAENMVEQLEVARQKELDAADLLRSIKEAEPRSIKEIIEIGREGMDAAKQYFNIELEKKIKDLTDPEKLKRIRGAWTATRKDSLATIIALKNERIAVFNAKHGSIGWVYPDGTEETTEDFYDPFGKESTRFLQSNILTLSSESGNGSLYSEIFHDFIGPIRVGFGGLLSNSSFGPGSDSTAVDAQSIAEDQAQRVLGGGGNTVATIALPLVGYTSPRGTIMFRFSFQPKLALDLTRYTDEQSSTPFHTDLGFEAHTNLAGSNGTLSFFGSARPSIIIGNPIFYDNLSKGDLRAIGMAQVRFGMGIGNTLRIGYSINAGGAFVRRVFPSQLSITLLTNG